MLWLLWLLWWSTLPSHFSPALGPSPPFPHQLPGAFPESSDLHTPPLPSWVFPSCPPPPLDGQLEARARARLPCFIRHWIPNAWHRVCHTAGTREISGDEPQVHTCQLQHAYLIPNTWRLRPTFKRPPWAERPGDVGWGGLEQQKSGKPDRGAGQVLVCWSRWEQGTAWGGVLPGQGLP